MDDDHVLAGTTLVKNYYTTMLKSPFELHRYYQGSSSMSWAREYGTGFLTAGTMTDIKYIISSLAYNIRKIDIKSLTAVNERIDDVVVRLEVTGFLTRDGDSNPRKFAHIFRLGSNNQGLYVKHDSFRFFQNPVKDSCGVSQKVISGNVGGKGHSVYVRGLPQSATPADVESGFLRFGHILKVKVGKVDEMKEIFLEEYHYGIVTFRDFASTDDAIKNSPVTICGKPAEVEPIAMNYPKVFPKGDVNRSLVPFRATASEHFPKH